MQKFKVLEVFKSCAGKRILYLKVTLSHVERQRLLSPINFQMYIYSRRVVYSPEICCVSLQVIIYITFNTLCFFLLCIMLEVNKGTEI